MKITRFRDIPQLTSWGSYKVTVDWNYLEDHLNNWNRPDLGNPLILDPVWQRAHVWDDEKRIKYVEYILRGGHQSKELIFNCARWNSDYNSPIYLVDGKQRLEAARKFLRNEIPAFGSFYSEYTDNLRGVVANFTFSMNDLKTEKEMLQFYIELNNGGVVHTEEELEKVRKMLTNLEK